MTGGNRNPFFKCLSIIVSGDVTSHLIKPKTSSFLIAFKTVFFNSFTFCIRMNSYTYNVQMFKMYNVQK